MLTILRKKEKSEKETEKIKENLTKINNDITITQVIYEETFNEKDNSITYTPKNKTINLTRKINLTAELLKKDTALQKLNQVKELLSKGE